MSLENWIARATHACARRAWSAVSLVAALVVFAPVAHAQFGAGGDIPDTKDLVKIHVAPVHVPAGGSAKASVELTILSGWHINANPAANENAIATEIAVAAAGGLAGKPGYPSPKIEKLSFDPEPLLVYDGVTSVPVTLQAAATAATGSHTLKGTIRFQSCNDQVCLPPATLTFEVPVVVDAAAAGAVHDTTATASVAAADTTAPTGAPAIGGAPPATGFATAPPAGYSGAAAPTGSANTASQKLGEALAKGGAWWFLALFVGGLLLNLTPCVFPMLGVTLSIFGARRKEPLARVLSHATLYVLGIAVMYSALGVIAALTGGLFGAALQNVWVNVGLGALMVVLSLSMFGLYEMQPPAAVMDRLGAASGTASFAGTFMAGLGVGIIAAPCVGPFVVAVLALIAQKQNALFGFQTMFTLSLGLGLPYLVLGTFSNLIQKLPRSGDWMVWVKGVFGVILAAVGAFYVLLALAPKWAEWVVPAALVLGGLYLGWLEKTKGRGAGFRVFKRVAGTAAMVAGVIVVLTTPTKAIEFAAADDAALKAAVASGRPVLLEFSADWCVPCHELERVTFSDRQVIAASRDFHKLKVDLTRYDSPESEAWRKTWRVAGVPTVIFIGAGGEEIPGLRFEGFVPPATFLERLRAASKGGGSAAN